MSNSPLVSHTNLSPNHSGKRTHAIDRITPHCFVGQVTAVRGCEVFLPTSKGASCNYVIGKDGDVGLCVEEKNRSWCTSSNANDQRAVTIECASDTTEPYAFRDAVYQRLIDLCVDICQRNGKSKLLWFADKNKTLAYNPKADEMVLTVHRWFANKSCPGNWMYARMGDLAEKVTARLSSSAGQTATPDEDTTGYTRIMGSAVATAAQMQAYIRSVNSGVAQSVLDMIPLYLSEGAAEGVRGDVAFAQSCLETGNFKFTGSAVTLAQNNFCGMGVTGNGMTGNSFDTPQIGIRAQIQHLKAYGSTEAVKNAIVDPRFAYVTRGCAEYVEYLGQQENPQGKGWAAGAGYGAKVLVILKKIIGTKVEDSGSATQPSGKELYRVRKSWDNAASQKGAFAVLDNAKKCADQNPGYTVYDSTGNAVYPTGTVQTPTPAAGVPYLVNVTISDLNIRKGPGTNYATTGKFTGKGVFTIVEVQSGKGSTKGWGRLKSGAGWISLDYAPKL